MRSVDSVSATAQPVVISDEDDDCQKQMSDDDQPGKKCVYSNHLQLQYLLNEFGALELPIQHLKFVIEAN